MPPEVRAISRNYMTSPKEVTVGKANSGNVNIDHQYYVAPAHQRYETLKRLIDFNPGMYGIIFTRTKADAQDISEKLSKAGYDIEALHGDLTQQQRDKVMGRFRSKTLQLLIATDVAARGSMWMASPMSSITNCPTIWKCTPTETDEPPCRQERYMPLYLPRSWNIRSGNWKEWSTVLSTNWISPAARTFAVNSSSTSWINSSLQTFPMATMKHTFRIDGENLLTYRKRKCWKGWQRWNSTTSEILRKRGRPECQVGCQDARQSSFENRDSIGGRRDRGFNRRDNGYTRLFINVGTKDEFYKASFLQFILDESNLKKKCSARSIWGKWTVGWKSTARKPAVWSKAPGRKRSTTAVWSGWMKPMADLKTNGWG